MRVLFVSTHFPSDLRVYVHGTFKRMRLFVDAVKEIAQLDMLFYVRSDRDISASAVSRLERSISDHWGTEIRLTLCPKYDRSGPLSKWQLYGSGALNFFRQGGYVSTSGAEQVQAFEECLRRKPDAIFAKGLPSMCPALLTKETLPPVFFDMDDIDHVVLARGIDSQRQWRSKLVTYLRVPALWWGERKAIRSARRTFVCSDLDRRYLSRFWRLPGVVTVPNAVQIAELQPLTADPTLLFLGSYWYRPNAEAAEFLLHRVWPQVHRAMPEARLIIAGPEPESIRGHDDALPSVEFTGFVEDIDALYRRSRVVCAPILSGGGTRVKIIEAAACGKPITATRLGAEGLELHDGRELLLRDDPESFAEACLQLLKDSALCKRLGHAAHEAASRHYDRANVIRLIQKYFRHEIGNIN
jgi:hypothetical protein